MKDINGGLVRKDIKLKLNLRFSTLSLVSEDNLLNNSINLTARLISIIDIRIL